MFVARPTTCGTLAMIFPLLAPRAADWYPPELN